MRLLARNITTTLACRLDGLNKSLEITLLFVFSKFFNEAYLAFSNVDFFPS